MLALELLGPVVLRRGGQPLPLTVRKTAALLVLLALGGAQVRPRVVALLWPALDESSGRRNLRRELARLRELGAEAAVQAEGDRITLAPAVTVDITAWAQAGDPGAALALWRGPLADGLDVDDAPPFMQWLAAERERLQAHWHQRLEAAAIAAEAQGDTATALAQLERLLADDPLQERHQRHAMRLLAAAGRREDALARYRRCRDLLQSELGLAPMAETEALAAALQAAVAAAAPAAPRTARAAAPLLPEQLPFVGREAEVAWLERAWRSGGTLLIEGEGGVGKSRLAVDFAAAHGPYALARCQPGDAELPLASLARALRVLAGPAPAPGDLPPWVAGELPRLLPELGPAPLPLRSEAERTRFGEAIAIAWVAWAGGNFDAVILDDWHLADAASQALLPRIVAQRLAAGGEPVREVLVCRPEGGPQADAERQRLRERGAAHLRLQPLAPQAVLDLLQRLSGAACPERFAHRLASATDGHPFYLAETLRHLAELGLLAADADGVWHTPFDADTEDYRELPLPPSVRDAVMARVQRLPEPARRVLDAAALAGEPFGAALLAPACALSEVEAGLALEAGFDARLLRELDGGGWGFAHDLVQQSLAGALSAERRRSVHRRLALGAAAAGAPPTHVAQHHEAGGEPQRAVPWRCRAAEAARRLHALDEAIAQWRLALADGADAEQALAIGLPLMRTLDLRGLSQEALAAAAALRQLVEAGAGTPAARLEAVIAIAGLLANRDECAQSLALLDALPPLSDERLRALALRARADALRGAGRIDDSLALAHAALEIPALAGEERGQLLDSLVLADLQAGRVRDALAHTEASLQLARTVGDGIGAVRALTRRGALLATIGDTGPAEVALREAVEATARLGLIGQQRSNLFNLCVLYSSLSQPQRVLAAAQECWDLPPPMPLEPMRTQMRLAFIEAHLALGNLGEAWTWMQGAIDDALALRQPVGLATVVCTGVELLTLLGEEARVAPLLQALDGPALAQLRYSTAEMRLVLAECALLQGDAARARAHLQGHSDDGEVDRVHVRGAIVQAALRLADGDAPAALSGLPADDAPGTNEEMRWRVLAVRLDAEAAAGGVAPATRRAADAALARRDVHAAAQLLLHRALRRADPAQAGAYAARLAELGLSLSAHPVQRAAFERRLA